MDEAHFRADAEMGEMGAKGRTGNGGFHQSQVRSEGQLSFSSMPGDGRGGFRSVLGYAEYEIEIKYSKITRNPIRLMLVVALA